MFIEEVSVKLDEKKVEKCAASQNDNSIDIVIAFFFFFAENSGKNH